MLKASNNCRIPGSFRDPSGFLFYREGVLYRQVNRSYRGNYEHLTESGLYRALVDAGLLLSHEELGEGAAGEDAYRIIRPEMVPFISYPYEWCFGQLKDAALATLAVQKLSFEFGMSLKDASAYNMQFYKGQPVLIDTLSFEIYKPGEPWVAYRQFCQHFLAPLALMSCSDVRLNQVMKIYIDGIPLDLAAGLLPYCTRFKPGLLSHIHLHAKSQQKYAGRRPDRQAGRFSRMAFLGLMDSLESTVNKLSWQPDQTAWARYYNENSYSDAAMENKERLVDELLERIKPASMWDLGANTGLFSRIASGKGINTVSFELDPACVELSYRLCRSQNDSNLLPLVQDLTNPSPAIGWENRERASLVERGPADTVLALALVHHMAIANNVPLEMVARFLNTICKTLIIEFVPKEDEQVQRLLAARDDIFPSYNRSGFEESFKNYFRIEQSFELKESRRVIYLMTSMPKKATRGSE